MNRKGFTIVELLVVVSIMALLMSILIPAIQKALELGYRTHCAANLKGIGQAIAAYRHENDEQYPRPGLDTATWGNPIDWEPGPGPADEISVTSCLYLLVKNEMVGCDLFICKSDEKASGVTMFKPSDYGFNYDVRACWDFGEEPYRHCSYAYHWPFGYLSLGFATPSGAPVAADHSPYCPTDPAEEPMTVGSGYFVYDGTEAEQKNGNSPSHKQAGQNVLFSDTSVKWEDRSFCGIARDNIYTRWNTSSSTPSEQQRQEGTPPPKNKSLYGKTFDGLSTDTIFNAKDAFLINEVEKGKGKGKGGGS